nr:unnamed protein product [Timema bartmani]
MKSFLVLTLVVLVAVCLHDSLAEKKCPEKCPSFTSPVCAKGQDIPPKTFKNSCEMGIYTCKNNVRKFAEIDAPTDASTTTHSHHCTLNILPLTPYSNATISHVILPNSPPTTPYSSKTALTHLHPQKPSRLYPFSRTPF